MRATFKSFAVASVIAMFAASSVLADRDGKDGGGGDREGGSRSSNSGGSRDGGSNRSSSGSRDGGSSRSMSSGSNRSSRSSDSNQSMRSSDSNRTLRSADSNRSSSQTFRSGDSDNRSSRSLDANRIPSNRGQSGTTQQFRSTQPGTRQLEGTRQVEGARQYEARRPTSDEVRNFLGDRGSDNVGRDGDRDRDQTSRDRNRGDFDRDHKQWTGTWYGNKRDGRDNRDWSGRWKDSDRFNVSDSIRRDWDRRGDNDRVFGGDWWRTKHRGNYWGYWGDYAHRHNRPWYWWSWATGPRLTNWVGFGWPTPYYWDYGRGEYLYYDNGAIYVNGRWYQPAPVFYDQTVRIIDDAPDLTVESAANLDWMPLGVFAVTEDGVAEPNVMVQLAVTKDGVMGGTAFDQKSSAAYNIQGMVDKKSQRAVWSFRDDRDKRVMMETSIYNLTQPEATGMVQYGPNDMRVVQLVRLKDPSAASQPAPGAESTLPAPPATR